MPWIKWYPADWLRDTRPLTLAAKGAWIDILSALHNARPIGQMTASVDQWARIMGTDCDEAARVLRELGNTGTAHVVTLSNNDVTVQSRRMIREETQREQLRQRVARHRAKHSIDTPHDAEKRESNGISNAHVTDRSQKPEARSQKPHINPGPDGPEHAIYEAYPRHVAKAPALKAIRSALKKKSSPELLERTQAYAIATRSWGADQHQFIPYPQKWFNEGRYDDDPATWKRNDKKPDLSHGRGFELAGDYSKVENKL